MKTSMNTLTGSKLKMPDKIYRHEIKYEADADKARLIKVHFDKLLQKDGNTGVDGSYVVKSLYFETPYNDDYSDKELGVQFRQKMRLRTYAGSNVFKMEIKSKSGDVATKYTAALSPRQAEKVARGDYTPFLQIGTAESLYIYNQLVTKVYRPLVVVAYKRYPYLHRAGNFRLTFDEDLRFSTDTKALFVADYPMGVVTDKTVIEIKYDDFAPVWVTDLLDKTGLNAGESSKYAASFRSIFD